MEKRLTNKFTMYKVVRDWILSNLTAFENLPGFADTFSVFCGILDTIVDLDKSKTTTTTGMTTTKGESRELLEGLVIEMVRILKVYATFANDHILLSDIDFTPSQLSRSSEQLLLVRSTKVIEYATSSQVDAEGYGLSTERLEALNAAYVSFSDKQTLVRKAVVNRMDAGEQLEAQMDEADDLLKGKLDLLVELSQNTYPELYNQYKASRIIIDR